MAESARASASASSAQSPPSAPSPAPALEALALQACDDAAQLHAVLQAHACIEKLIAPHQVGEPEDLMPTRSELGSLLQLANAGLKRCVDAVDHTTLLLRSTLTAGELGKKPT